MLSESIYVISLSRLYWTRRYRRAARALKYVRSFIKRHTKAEKVFIDESVNHYIFTRRYDRPPRKIVVAVMKLDQEGKVVKVSLAVPIEPARAMEGSTQ